MAVGFGSLSAINDLDEMLGYESLSLSCVCSIEDGALRFFHVTREEASRDLIRPIRNRRLRFLDGSSNPGLNNSSNEWLGLIHLI